MKNPVLSPLLPIGSVRKTRQLLSIHAAALTFTYSSHCCFHARPKDTETEKEEEQQGGQAAQDSVHGRAAAETENGVPGQPVHNGAAETVSGPGTQPERVPN